MTFARRRAATALAGLVVVVPGLVVTASQSAAVTGSPPAMLPGVSTRVEERLAPATVRAARLVRAHINARRRAIGARRFDANACLADFARDHSQRMMKYGKFEHSSDSFFRSRGHAYFGNVCPKKAPGWRGEVIALVHASSARGAARDAYRAWMSSAGHRAILEERSGWGHQIGAGFARRGGRWWATVVTAYKS